MGFEREIAFCREKVSPDYSSLHYALVFLPVQERAFWLGCKTLFHEIRRATTQQLDAGLTQVKLGWWQQALSDCQENKAQHPVILAIGQATVNAVPNLTWNEIINNGVDSCEPQRYETLEDWHEHLYSLLKPWQQVIECKFGLDDCSALLKFWVYSIQETQLLRLAKYIDQNFQPIPVKLLEKHEVTANMLQSRTHNENVSALFYEVSQAIMLAADQAWKNTPKPLKLHARPLRALNKMRHKELRMHQDEHFKNILIQQHVLSPGRKFFIAWSTFVFKS